MKDWLAEIIDQIALGEVLAHSKISCGQRFGLIAVDNAVEFMLIAYVEVYKQLVGGHKPGGITKKDWDDVKRQFPKLLSHVLGLEPALLPLEVEIGRFHDFRNNLYHSGIPVTTSPGRVTSYSKLAREVLAVLFGIPFSAEEWENALSQAATSLGANTKAGAIKWQVTYELVDGLVKFSTSATLAATEAIALCLHGYSVLTGASPSRPSFIQSLARSGYPLSSDIVNARAFDLRKTGWLQKNDLVLTGKGRKELAKKFLLY